MDQCLKNLDVTECCHDDGRECNCYICLNKGYRETLDEYDCTKKMNYYVLKYGSSYASEFYQYFDTSQIIEQYLNSHIKVLSLGCGFAPDYFALDKYIKEKKLNISFEFTGIDNSNFWDTARINTQSLEFIHQDILNQLNFDNYDIIIVAKVFSTVYRHQKADIFLTNLKSSIQNTMKENAYLIFNDINSRNMGRDKLSRFMDKMFQHVRTYYCGNPPYVEQHWEIFRMNRMFFHIINNPKIDPLNQLRNNVFFEYRK